MNTRTLRHPGWPVYCCALAWLSACNTVPRNFDNPAVDAGSDASSSTTAASGAMTARPDASVAASATGAAPTHPTVGAPDAAVSEDAATEDAGSSLLDSSVIDATLPPEDSSVVEDSSISPIEMDSGMQPVPLPGCAVALISDVGHVSNSTAEADGTFTSECAPAGLSDDVAYLWRAPAAGYYTISTEGSSFDTVLSVRPPVCDGDELECNDDTATSIQSEIVRKFAKHETALIVVDGKVGGNGEVELNISRVNCPAQDLTEQVLPATFTTQDGSSQHEGTCGGAGRREKTFRWVAPGDAFYRFRATSTDFSPALYVERGARCGGVELGCSTGSALGTPAWVTQRLSAGEAVTLIVDSNDGVGSFDLDVETLPESNCAVGDFAPLTDYQIYGSITQYDLSTVSASCAPAEIVMLPAGSHPLPEHAYNVSVPGRASCSIQIEADGPFVVYSRAGLECGGAENSCEQSTPDADYEMVRLSMGSTSSPDPVSGTLVIEALADLQDKPLSYVMRGLCAIP